MIVLKTKNQMEQIKKAGDIVVGMHENLRGFIKPGITTMEINNHCEEYIRSQGGIPAQIGYQDFPYATCVSVNDEICHGYPSDRVLVEGDLVKVDTVVELDGYMADSCWAYACGELEPEVQQLFEVTHDCLYKGIEQAVVGNRLGDIGHAIQSYAEENGFSVVREFTGHGIGRDMHEPPFVPHYGKPGRGPRLEEGMVLTIEPMINLGKKELHIDEDDGWTARTNDGSWSCQFEHTLAITKDGPVLFTKQSEPEI